MGLALVALGEEPERVDLLDEVGHASPTSESESDNEHPNYYECIHHIHGSPAWHEKGQLLCCILFGTSGHNNDIDRSNIRSESFSV